MEGQNKIKCTIKGCEKEAEYRCVLCLSPLCEEHFDKSLKKYNIKIPEVFKKKLCGIDNSVADQLKTVHELSTE